MHVGISDDAYRPACVITFPGSRRLIVDSVVPIENYLDALQASDEAKREAASRKICKNKGAINGTEEFSSNVELTYQSQRD